jgi:hypothetical protein
MILEVGKKAKTKEVFVVGAHALSPQLHDDTKNWGK